MYHPNCPSGLWTLLTHLIHLSFRLFPLASGTASGVLTAHTELKCFLCATALTGTQLQPDWVEVFDSELLIWKTESWQFPLQGTNSRSALFTLAHYWQILHTSTQAAAGLIVIFSIFLSKVKELIIKTGEVICWIGGNTTSLSVTHQKWILQLEDSNHSQILRAWRVLQRETAPCVF